MCTYSFKLDNPELSGNFLLWFGYEKAPGQSWDNRNISGIQKNISKITNGGQKI